MSPGSTSLRRKLRSVGHPKGFRETPSPLDDVLHTHGSLLHPQVYSPGIIPSISGAASNPALDALSGQKHYAATVAASCRSANTRDCRIASRSAIPRRSSDESLEKPPGEPDDVHHRAKPPRRWASAAMRPIKKIGCAALFLILPMSDALADDLFVCEGRTNAFRSKPREMLWTRADEIAIRVRGTGQVELSGADNLPGMVLSMCSGGQEDAIEFASEECDFQMMLRNEDIQIYGTFNKLLGKLFVVFKNQIRDPVADKMVERESI